jgi:hypothetical protein
MCKLLIIHPKLEIVFSFSEFLPLMIAPKVKFQSCLLENIPVNVMWWNDIIILQIKTDRY